MIRFLLNLARSFVLIAAVAFALGGCDGKDGAVGPVGPTGATGPTGGSGPPGPPAGELPLEPAGVVGYVNDVAAAPLDGGTVFFVPAADVAALPPTTIEVDSTNDEPLEDLIAANAAAYQQAMIESDGSYAVPVLADGSYFVTFVPADDDPGHLPGGNAARVAVDAASLVGTQFDLRVSSAAPEDATYVGSGVCVSCHGRAHISETMHRIGIWKPADCRISSRGSMTFTWQSRISSRYLVEQLFTITTSTGIVASINIVRQRQTRAQAFFSRSMSLRTLAT